VLTDCLTDKSQQKTTRSFERSLKTQPVESTEFAKVVVLVISACPTRKRMVNVELAENEGRKSDR